MKNISVKSASEIIADSFSMAVFAPDESTVENRKKAIRLASYSRRTMRNSKPVITVDIKQLVDLCETLDAEKVLIYVSDTAPTGVDAPPIIVRPYDDDSYETFGLLMPLGI